MSFLITVSALIFAVGVRAFLKRARMKDDPRIPASNTTIFSFRSGLYTILLPDVVITPFDKNIQAVDVIDVKHIVLDCASRLNDFIFLDYNDTLWQVQAASSESAAIIAALGLLYFDKTGSRVHYDSKLTLDNFKLIQKYEKDVH